MLGCTALYYTVLYLAVKMDVEMDVGMQMEIELCNDDMLSAVCVRERVRE